MTVATAWQTARIRVYNRDAVTERTGSPITAPGFAWTDTLSASGTGSPGAELTTQWLMTAIQTNPTLLRDAWCVVEVQLTAGGAWTPVYAFLADLGQGVIVDDQGAEDAGRNERLTCRDGLDLLADWMWLHDPGVVRENGGDQRYLGYMSSYFDSSGFANAQGVPWSSDPTWRGTAPGGPYPTIFGTLDQSAQWIAAVDPTVTQPAGTKNVLWGKFTTTAALPIQLIAAADNILTLYLDGELVYTPDAGGTEGWRDPREPYRTVLPAGNHVVVALIENGSTVRPDNPIGLICHVDKLDAAGNPTQTLLRSDTSWKAADASAVPALTAAAIVRRLRYEMANWSIGAIPSATRITPTFTDTHDSSATPVAWPDVQDRAVQIGDSGRKTVSDLAPLAFDIVLRPDLKLDAYVNRGTDKSSTINLFDPNCGLLYFDFDGIPLVATRLLVRHAAGWLLLQDTTAEASVDARCGSMDSGLSMSAAQGGAVAEANLKDKARPSQESLAVLIARPGFTPKVDLDLGDQVMARDSLGASIKMQLVSLGGRTVGGDEGPLAWVLRLRQVV